MASETQRNQSEELDASSDYDEDVMKYMYSRENDPRNRADPNCMSRQPHLTHETRTKIFNWLSWIRGCYHLPQEVWSLGMNYFDRILSKIIVSERNARLLGLACFYIAWKIDNNKSVVDVQNLLTLVDSAYKVNEMLKMEAVILKTLSFDVSPPTATYFCDKYLEASQANPNTCFLSRYLVELTLMDGEHSLNYLPSQIAASCIFVARLVLFYPAWNKILAKVTGHKYESMMFCITAVHNVLRIQPSRHYEHVYHKYSEQSFNQVGTIKILPLTSYVNAHLYLEKKS